MPSRSAQLLSRCWPGVLGIVLAAALGASCAAPALAAVKTPEASGDAKAPVAESANSLEAAAAKAGTTGRAVAMSLIGLGLAIAGIVLAFKRDFKEAAGVFAVGVVAVLLATPSGVSLLRATVASLFGSS
jgi:hypothetical protein